MNNNIEAKMTQWGLATVSDNIIQRCMESASASADEYIKAADYLNRQGLEVVHVPNFDYAAHTSWAPKDSPLLKEAQTRAGGLNAIKANRYKDRFDDGETLKRPPIEFWTGEETIPGIGHTRTDAKRRSTNSVGPAFFVDLSAKSKLAQRAIILEIASYGNKESKDDRDLDSMSDAAKQSVAYWNIVMEMDPDADASELALKEQLKLRTEYDKLSTDEEKEEFRLNWHASWMDARYQYQFRNQGERTKIYKVAFTEARFSPLKEEEWTAEGLADVYTRFWPNNEWNPTEWSIKEKPETSVHQFITGFATHSRNYRRTVSDLGWNYDGTYTVETMIYGNPKVTNPDTRAANIESHLKVLTEYNNNARRTKWGLPEYKKVIFLQGLITEDDDSYAYEWNTQHRRFDQVK
tara:strand:+ start:5853 stop:7073 length:1221 start_codon:yes stop_codon:yes gene_type:complete